MRSDTPRADAVSKAAPLRDAEAEPERPTQVWVVRADRGKYTDRFVAGGYAATDELDCSSAESGTEIRRRYGLEHPELNAHEIGAQVAQLKAFLLDMREGDYIFTPTSDPRWLRYGRVTGGCYGAVGNDGCPYLNRRPVEWEVTTRIDRTSLSETSRGTLRSRMSVFAIKHPEELLTVIRHVTPLAPAVARRRDGAGVEESESPEGGYRFDGETERSVEMERDDPQQGPVERPFDPSKIKVRTVPVVVEQIVSRIKYGEIDLAPDFQRMSGIWNAERKSRLIESLLLRIPIPMFYVAADDDENWAVVDGVQRISTINDYVTGKFALTRLEYRRELENRHFQQLPRVMQRRIGETQFVVNVIEPGTPREVMFNIFRRINTGGMPLYPQEIRHALNPGPVREYLKTLAESPEFLNATERSIRPHRMDDRECVLRFLAFHVEPWEEYTADSLDSHLESAMLKINAMEPARRDELATEFKKAMEAAVAIFGNDAFRRFRPDGGRYQISRALFEAWAVQLARCSPEEITRLAERRTEVRDGFMRLLNEDPEFLSAISASTSSPPRIRKRFAAVRDLVQEFL